MEDSKTNKANTKKASKQSDNSATDNAVVIKQKHQNNKELQTDSNRINAANVLQKPARTGDTKIDNAADAPLSTENSLSTFASDVPTSSINVGDSGAQNHTADNNESRRFNWLIKNPDSGDYYRNSYRKNFSNDGGAFNIQNYQKHRRNFNDNSRYKINRVYDRNNSWKHQNRNSTNPRHYKSRWDNPNPYSRYNTSRTQSSFYADDSLDQANNVGNKNKTDDEFRQFIVSSGITNSTNTEITPSTRKGESAIFKPKKNRFPHKHFTPERREKYQKSRENTPTSSRLAISSDCPHNLSDASQNLRKIQYQSPKAKATTPGTSKNVKQIPNKDNKKSCSKTGKNPKSLNFKSSESSKESVSIGTAEENLANVVAAQTNSLEFVTQQTIATANKEVLTSPKRPKISLIPLAKLIRNELLDLAANDIISSTQSDLNPSNNTPSSPSATFDASTINLPIQKPNLVTRRRNISCCSNSSQTDSLIEKVVNMDKSGIKNVINSSGTKYDEALKIQARKRLREEIRKQLKSMNLEKPSTNTENIESVADDIVNSIDLPQTVMDEIRKAFGIELLESIEQQDVMPDSEKSAEPATTAAQSVMPVTARRVSSDLMSRIKAAEQLKSFTEKTPPKELHRRITRLDDEDNSKAVSAMDISKLAPKESSSHKTHPDNEYHKKTSALPVENYKKEPRKNQNKSKITSKKSHSGVIVIESSGSSDSSTSNSSSSSSSSSSSEDSDTDSTTSAKSNSSSVRRRLQRQKIISENVVNSFETLILPNLSEAQRNRYKEKYSATTNIKLHFISCICTSEYNTQKFSKIETAKLQRNLKAEDNASALEFLMREIVNVFNKQKKLRQEKEKLSQNATEKETHKAEETNKLMTSQSKTPTKSSELTTITNKTKQPTNRISPATTTSSESAEQKEATKNKNVNSAENTTGKRNQKEILLERQLQSVNEQTSIKQRATTATKAVGNVADKAKSSTQRIIGNAKRKTKNAVIAGDKENPIKRMNVDEEEQEDNAHNESNTIESSSTESVLVREEYEIDYIEEEESNHESAKDESGRNMELIIQTRVTSSASQQSQQRQWKSPGEKKCVDKNKTVIASATTTSNSNLPGSLQEYKENLQKSSYCGDLENVTGLAGFSSLAVALDSFTQHPHILQPVDLDALRHNSLVGEAVVSNLREIDVKLMELHKRKMFIEEMILKLQKEKMEADLQTIKLQNEKFILLNTAMTANATAAAAVACNATGASPTGSVPEKPSSSTQDIVSKTESSKDCGTNTEAKITVKKIIDKRKAPPNSSKLRNPKKRCQGDIVVEDTAKIRQLNKTAKTVQETKKTESSRTRSSNRSTNEAITPPIKTYKRRTNKKIDSESITVIKELPSTTTTTSRDPIKKTLILNTDDEIVLSSSCPTETAEKVCTTEKPSTQDSLMPAYDYSNVPTGNLDGIKSPVTQILVFEDSIIASSEDGNLYKFNIRSLQLEKHFPKHSEAITQMNLCQLKKVLYTTSLDGYLKKSSIENFDLDILTVYLEEPLQSIDVQWGIAFIGSRWGNIFTYDLTTNHLAEALLCSSDSSIIALKATKEGPRKILIVSSKGNLIHFRDATTGLLLRSISVPENVHIFSLMLDFGSIYCGTQKNEIYKFDFTTGARLATMNCGNGAVSMKLYKGKFLFVGCYDGFVYVLDKESGCQIGRFPGSGKLVLALEIAGDKLLTSAKDKTMQVIDIPKYIVAKAKV